MILASDFLPTLSWIDGKPLRIERYRLSILTRALDGRLPDGSPAYSLVLAGRGKKNCKSLDLILAALFCLMCREPPQGSDVILIANDEGQAGDDLDLAKKLVGINPHLAESLEILSKEIRRRDGRGTMYILASGNAAGAHGKTAQFIGYDEIHAFRDWDLMEALQPDPTRRDVLQWITSYDSIYDVEGCPLHDLKKIGIAGSDPRMLFSWYSAEYCNDPNFATLPPDERANPSMDSWPEGKRYLEQQRRRLPSARFRRLHHNMPGAPQGAFFDQSTVETAIVAGRHALDPVDGIDYFAAVDMSGGSSDDAVLAISHWDGSKAVLDLLIEQADAPPFNPRRAVARFAATCRRYRCTEITGDAYAGETFRSDFSEHGITYKVAKQTRTDIYEDMEVALNAGQAELLDSPKLHRQMLTIVRRGATLDHQPGQHDDYVTAAALAVVLVNPDVGGGSAVGWLAYYKRLSESADAPPPAPELPPVSTQFSYTFAPASVPAAGLVRVVAPDGLTPSVLLGASGRQYGAAVIDGRWTFDMLPDDAKALCAGGLPSNLAWREANPAIVAQLGVVPPLSAGVRVVDLLQAAADAAPRHPADRGGISTDTMTLFGASR